MSKQRNAGNCYWLELYNATVLESDTAKLAILLPEAQGAIRKRIGERWYGGSDETAERERLEAAFCYLELERRIIGKDAEEDWNA